VPLGWALTNVTSNASDWHRTDDTAQVILQPGEIVNFYFTDKQINLGSVTLVKNGITSVQNPPQTFAFSTNLSPSDVILTATGQQTFTNLFAGTYTIKELVPTGWDLTKVTIIDQNTGQPVGDVQGAMATINLTTNENVVVTYYSGPRKLDHQLTVQRYGGRLRDRFLSSPARLALCRLLPSL
jgi:hypothetical protein